MKRILLSLGLLTLGVSANAQSYYFEDFSGSAPSWTFVDRDGDGYNWNIYDFGANGKSLVSQSFINDVGSLSPDNIAISPAITLGSDNLELKFKVRGLDANYSYEHYGIYVTTSNDESAILASPLVYEETLPNGVGTFVDRTVDLSAFAGQTVYITFRHWNISDVYWLIIDDIRVGATASIDVGLIDLDMPYMTAVAEVLIKGTVKNYSTHPISQITVTYNAGSGDISNTISQNIPAGGTYNFIHPTALTVQSGNSYNIDICVTTEGDQIVANDCATTQILVVSQVVNKYVVAEEKTGTWCGWCPRGTVAMDFLHHNDTLAIPIAIHNADPMAVSSYDTQTNNLPDFTGYPHAAADRVYGIDPGDIQSAVNMRKSVAPPCSVDFESITVTGNTLKINARANMVVSLEGNYGLAVVLTEDSVKGSGSGWKQVNYYNTQGLNLTDMHGNNWKNLSSPVDQSAMGGYNHVARAVGSNNIKGANNSLPSSLTADASYTFEYTFTVSNDWNLDNMHAVAMFVDKNSGEIINAGTRNVILKNDDNGNGNNTGGLAENGLNFGLNVFPNPTADFANINIELNETSSVGFALYNMVGELVHQIPAEIVEAGSHVYSMNVVDFPSGMYIAHVSVNGTIKTVKLNVVK